MKKVFSLFFVSVCFAIIGLVLWAGSASAQPFPVPPPGGGIQACYAQQVSPVPQTGQTTIYAEGDDGDIQAGVVLPNPRFTDNGDGTITDNLTHLIWLKDANCSQGDRSWDNALADVEELNSSQTMNGHNCDNYTGTFTDWRLPNVRELQSLINYAFNDPALSDSAGTAEWAQGDAFTDIGSASYWSSTTDANFTDFGALFAWFVNFDNGDVLSSNKTNGSFVLPVRGGS